MRGTEPVVPAVVPRLAGRAVVPRCCAATVLEPGASQSDTVKSAANARDVTTRVI
jgi:hypothetical protein